MEKLLIAISVAAVIGLGSLVYHIWTFGDDESDYSIVCLGGHQYWRANFAAKGFLGIKLDDAGKPVMCKYK
jgi:hypothetical protein